MQLPVISGVLAVLWGSPALADDKDPDEILLKEARDAKAAGDAESLRTALEGWATLRHRRVLPTGLEAEAAEAVDFAVEAGLLQVFGSRMPDRVRVGVRDPAGLVDRLDVWVAEGEDKQRLSRLISEQPDRHEFKIDDARWQTKEIMVDAIFVRGGEKIVLRRSVLLPTQRGLPTSPDPKMMAEKILPPSAPVEVHKAEAALSWWWIAGSVVAAGLAGAAIWQETRF